MSGRYRFTVPYLPHKKIKTPIGLKLKTRAEDSTELGISKCSLANKEI